ncbi:hypothetical protein [Bradyrhizobium sp. dw_78]|uniref:hypothetical protein n=1 Tax=Bradyrhizobium sp. dw_78 TaxID=2719793 RepID=UPI001BD20359|nr:hypothetical protein [Bradyrhizobium sp. dw_78]
MRSKILLSALVAASLAGATTIASAQSSQMQPAPGASSEGNVGPGATSSSGHMKSSKMKSGTTTGMSKGTSRNPSSEGNVGPGTGSTNGSSPGNR